MPLERRALLVGVFLPSGRRGGGKIMRAWHRPWRDGIGVWRRGAGPAKAAHGLDGLARSSPARRFRVRITDSLSAEPTVRIPEGASGVRLAGPAKGDGIRWIRWIRWGAPACGELGQAGPEALWVDPARIAAGAP